MGRFLYGSLYPFRLRNHLIPFESTSSGKKSRKVNSAKAEARRDRMKGRGPVLH